MTLDAECLWVADFRTLYGPGYLYAWGLIVYIVCDNLHHYILKVPQITLKSNSTQFFFGFVLARVG